MEEGAHGGKLPKAHESHSEVLAGNSVWGTRRVLSWFGATQLAKVVCKNGPNSSHYRGSLFFQPLNLGWRSQLLWTIAVAQVPWSEF